MQSSHLHSHMASFDVTTLDVQELENRIEMDGDSGRVDVEIQYW